MRSIFDDEPLPEPGSVLAAAEVTARNAPKVHGEASSELDMPLWAVISFDRIEARAMTYSQAAIWMQERLLQHVSGLCVVTDEAAARIEAHRFAPTLR